MTLRIERVVVTGGRKFSDYERIETDLRALLPLGLRAVAQGGARGADGIARAISCRLHDEVTEATRGTRYVETNVYTADWQGEGKAAGPRRNIRMLEAERPDLVLAYPDPDSRGTWHCVKQAIHRGIPVACWIGSEYDFRGEAGMWRHHLDKPSAQVMSFGRAYVVDFDCVLGENSRVIVVPSKRRGDGEALELGRAIRDALRQP